MKRFLLFFVLFVSIMGANAQDIPFSVYNYNVRYHMEFIDVNMGVGVVRVSNFGENFTGTISGHSIPWEGRVFCINDKVTATLTPSEGNISYLNGWYMKPTEEEFQSGTYGVDYPQSFKNLQGQGELDASPETMEAVKIMSEMTMLYYYFDIIDFPSMNDYDVVTIPFTTPNGSEQVRITYIGRSNCTIEGIDYPSYLVNFEFSYDGAMSGYTVAAQVDVNTRVPLMFSSRLPIGHVEMTLIQ